MMFQSLLQRDVFGPGIFTCFILTILVKCLRSFLMILSKLNLNTICSQVKKDIANPYELHRTIMRAFPTPCLKGKGYFFVLKISPIRVSHLSWFNLKTNQIGRRLRRRALFIFRNHRKLNRCNLSK